MEKYSNRIPEHRREHSHRTGERGDVPTYVMTYSETLCLNTESLGKFSTFGSACRRVESSCFGSSELVAAVERLERAGTEGRVKGFESREYTASPTYSSK